MIETPTENGKTIHLSVGYVARAVDRLWRQPPAQWQARIARAKLRVTGKFGSRTEAAITVRRRAMEMLGNP
jgi:hypothetical protein